jgi:hypothetical protein
MRFGGSVLNTKRKTHNDWLTKYVSSANIDQLSRFKNMGSCFSRAMVFVETVV